MAAECEPRYALPKGCMRALWETSLIISPAARAAVVLCSAAHLRLHQADPFRGVFLHRLRGHALSCIRTALDDPERCTSDAVLVAVISVAMSERLCGWQDNYAVHMRGLAQIRKARSATIDRTLEGILSCAWSIKWTQVSNWTSAAYSLPMSSFQTNMVKE